MKKILSLACALALSAAGASFLSAQSTFRIGVYGEGNLVVPLGSDDTDHIDAANDNSLLFGIGGGGSFEFGLPFLLAGYENGLAVRVAGAGLLPQADGIGSASFAKAVFGYWVRFPISGTDFAVQPELGYGVISKGLKVDGSSSSEVDQLLQAGVSLRWAPSSVLDGHLELELTPEFGIETVGMGHDTEHNLYTGLRIGALLAFGGSGSGSGAGSRSAEAKAKAKAAQVSRTEEQIKALDIADVEVTSDDLGVTLILINVHFLPDSAELEQEELVKLDKLSTILKQSKKDLLVTGHCAATTDTDSDMSLSIERAEAVADYLLKNKVRTRSHISARGKGSTEPIGDNYTESGRIKNRRVEITILDK